MFLPCKTPKCFICFVHLVPVKEEPTDDDNEDQLQSKLPEGCPVDLPLLGRHLDVFFVMKYVVELSPKKFRWYFFRCGSPGDWFYFCPECMVSVNRLKKLFSRIDNSAEVREEFEKEKWIVLEKIRISDEVKNTLKRGCSRGKLTRFHTNVFQECRKVGCELSKKERGNRLPASITQELLQAIKEKSISILRYQCPGTLQPKVGYNFDHIIVSLPLKFEEMELEEQVQVKEEIVIKEEPSSPCPVPNDLEMEIVPESYRIPAPAATDTVTKATPNPVKQRKTKYRWRIVALPRSTSILCPICKEKFFTGKVHVQILPFSSHLKVCMARATSTCSTEISTLTCSICNKDQIFKIKSDSYEDIIRLFLEHVILCRDHDVPHVWRHHLMKCNLCPDSVLMTYPEFSNHIWEKHLWKYSCIRCPSRRFEKASDCFNNHWTEEHEDEMNAVAWNYRYEKCNPILPEVPWLCPCKQIFKDEESRDQHHKTCKSKSGMRRFVRTNFHSCSFCGIKYHCDEELMMHRVMVHEVKTLAHKRPTCSECSMSFDTAEELKNHSRKEHQLHPIICKHDGCQFQTFENKLFERHKKSAHGIPRYTVSKKVLDEEPVPCPKCDKVFPTAKKLRGHDWQVHRRMSERKCEECGSVLSTKSGWITHMRNVHKIDPTADREKFLCPEPDCGRMFTTFWTLECHQKTAHSNVDTCLNCGRRFWLPLALKKHITLCTAITDRTKCLRCDLRFATRDLLLEHNVEEHGLKINKNPEDQPEMEMDIPNKFTCDLCNDKEFGSEKMLMNHIRMIHRNRIEGQRWTCEMCGVNYSDERLLSNHMLKRHKVGDIKCDQCEELFRTEKGLRFHKTKIHNRRGECQKHKCEECEMEFVTVSQIQIHRWQVHPKRPKGNQNLVCDQCGKAFRTKTKLSKHQANVHNKKIKKAPLEDPESKSEQSFSDKKVEGDKEEGEQTEVV